MVGLSHGGAVGVLSDADVTAVVGLHRCGGVQHLSDAGVGAEECKCLRGGRGRVGDAVVGGRRVLLPSSWVTWTIGGGGREASVNGTRPLRRCVLPDSTCNSMNGRGKSSDPVKVVGVPVNDT